MNTTSTSTPPLTRHARERLAERCIPLLLLQQILEYGRRLRGSNGKTLHLITERDMASALSHGVDLHACRALHVITDTVTGAVVSAYRDFTFGTMRRFRRYQTRNIHRKRSRNHR